MKNILSIIFSFSLTFVINAADKGAAKVIILKGKAAAKLGEAKPFDIKKGMWLKEGTQIKTADKSFLKLLFVDKSQMNLGPKSQMKIESFKKEKAGIINLVKGSLRSKVTKDYLKIKDKSKSKLFIKTKSAAMGIRGTEFLVNFNAKNNFTSLVTFSGAVAMAKLENTLSKVKLDQSRLETIVSSKSAVIVRKGQYSGSSPKQKKVSPPVKINPGQLESLKKNDTGLETSKKEDEKEKGPKDKKISAKPKKKFRSVLPPGADGKSFANTESQVEVIAAEAPPLKKPGVDPHDQNAPPPPTDISPAAGGFIDLKTAIYIPPPPGSAFDPVTQTYIPPTNVGYFDPDTGHFQNDFYDLKETGEFVLKEEVKQEMESGTTDGREPASLEDGQELLPPPPPPPPLELSGDYFVDGYIAPEDEIQHQEDFYDPNKLEELADTYIEETNQEIIDDVNTDTIKNTSRTTFGVSTSD